MATIKKAAAVKPAAEKKINPDNVEFFPNWTAFPTSYANARHEKGLTKREQVAAMIVGHTAAAGGNLEPETIVQEAVNLATLLLMECARVTLAEMAVEVEFEKIETT